MIKNERKEGRALIKKIQNLNFCDKKLINQTKIECNSSYGFTSDPDLPIWHNISNVLRDMTPITYFSRPRRMAFHNLCEREKPPEGIGITLGLDLKFCVQLDKAPNQLEKSANRFMDDVRKRYHFAGSKNKQVPKNIYVKSDWVPPKADEHIEGRMEQFCSKIACESNFLHQFSKKSSNLSHLQKYHLNLLRSNRDFIILYSDKNLGPAIMERNVYIKSILDEHLLKTSTYQQLNEAEGMAMINSIRRDTWQKIKAKSSELQDFEIKYFRSSFMQGSKRRVPQFYGTPKVHKNRRPIPFRPVVSQCGSISAIVSTFIDYKLQPLTKYIPSYVKNSTALLDELDKFNTLPTSAKIFTSDATAMYTNIDPDEGIDILRKYLEVYNKELGEKQRIDIDLICDLTDIVMRRNVFQFGSTWWHQLVGTAMGTPCACIYAIIFFAYFERQQIMVKYKRNLLLYRRQIDDIFGIWIEDPSNPNAWNDFKQDINSYTKLDWNTEELSHRVNFLDLTIWIDKQSNTIQYKTYQKPMSLFLYIPAHSAHPPGVLKSIVHGLISTYKRQNSTNYDFKKQINLLYNRLLTRGYDKEVLIQLFDEVATKIDEKPMAKVEIATKNEEKIADEGKQIFYHMQYHPKSVSRQHIQQAYTDTCDKVDNLGESFQCTYNALNDGYMKIKKLTVAYSRPKNLRDILSPSRLEEFDGCRVTNFLEGPRTP